MGAWTHGLAVPSWDRSASRCFGRPVPFAFLAVVAREILTGKNWRKLPMVGALSLLFAGNLLVHLDALSLADTAELGDRIGLATVLMLISLVGDCWAGW